MSKLLGCGLPVAVVLILTAFGLRALIDELRYGPDRHALGYLRSQVANVKAGTQDFIIFDNEVGDPGPDGFAQALSDLKNIDHFELHIMYSHGVDDYLKQIHGLRRLTTLVVAKSDLTDEGMEHVATFPDLTSLRLHNVRVTDKGIKTLESCPTLKHLAVSPYLVESLSVQAIVALPQLHTLAITEPYEKDWLKNGIEEIDDAPSLQELTLFCPTLTEADMEHLRSKLPHCKVRAFNPTGRDAEEIAPLATLLKATEP